MKLSGWWVKCLRSTILSLVCVLFSALGARADVFVTYQLDNVKFFDGDVATGSFTYNYTTLGNCCQFQDWVSNINIILTAPVSPERSAVPSAVFDFGEGGGINVLGGVTDVSFSFSGKSKPWLINDDVSITLDVPLPLSAFSSNPLDLRFAPSIGLSTSSDVYIGFNDCPVGIAQCEGPVIGWQAVSGSLDPVAAVPELSTWTMMLLGFAGIGFVGYRRQRATCRAVHSFR